MNNSLALTNIRVQLGRIWLIALFGIAYIISQTTILLILGPINEAMLELQLGGTSAAEYLTVFRDWVTSGDMDFYRAHFILDDPHPIWYAGLFTTLLCWQFERLNVSHKYNWMLLLPLGSGLLDWYENKLQHIFLSTSDFSTIIDPLPLYSTLASDIKWLFSLIYISLSIVLIVRIIKKRRHGANLK
jgi:hypothetical protein